MRLGELGLGGWLRVAGTALLGAGMMWVFGTMLAWTSNVAAIVAAAVGVGFAVVIVAVWSATGGYAARRAVRAWIRGGPDPVGVPTARRVRLLARFIDRSVWAGWLGIVLAVLFAASGTSQLAGGSSWQEAVLAIAPAATWAAVGVWTLVVERPRLPRARALYDAELQRASWADLPPV